nr:hypothetical protein [Angustibacter aerolatus]
MCRAASCSTPSRATAASSSGGGRCARRGCAARAHRLLRQRLARVPARGRDDRVRAGHLALERLLDRRARRRRRRVGPDDLVRRRLPQAQARHRACPTRRGTTCRSRSSTRSSRCSWWACCSSTRSATTCW